MKKATTTKKKKKKIKKMKKNAWRTCSCYEPRNSNQLAMNRTE